MTWSAVLAIHGMIHLLRWRLRGVVRRSATAWRIGAVAPGSAAGPDVVAVGIAVAVVVGQVPAADVAAAVVPGVVDGDLVAAIPAKTSSLWCSRGLEWTKSAWGGRVLPLVLGCSCWLGTMLKGMSNRRRASPFERVLRQQFLANTFVTDPSPIAHVACRL